MDLSKKDRLIIANQLKILEHLYPEEADYYSQHRKAIESGYKLNYDWLLESIYDEMSEADCKEVINILDMYRAMTFSYKKLDDKKGIDENAVKFNGFDGNEETNYFGYARYLMIDLNRFDELKYSKQYPDLNSHCPMLGKYRRMLIEWNKCSDKYDLTKDEILRILRA